MGDEADIILKRALLRQRRSLAIEHGVVVVVVRIAVRLKTELLPSDSPRKKFTCI
ncbi:MAG: hypothetical protein ABI612_08460 [Betaproteobacteria bacterium]